LDRWPESSSAVLLVNFIFVSLVLSGFQIRISGRHTKSGDTIIETVTDNKSYFYR
jgi:hypothetical protein